MKSPAWVTAGYVDPAGRCARYRAQRIARRIRDRIRGARTFCRPFNDRLARLCDVFDFPGPAQDSPAGLARRIRTLRNDYRTLFIR